MLQLASEFEQERLDALGRPTRRVFIFSPDLSEQRLDSNEAIERLSSLFLSSPAFELRLILHSDAWLKERASKLRSLLERRAHQTQIRLTRAEAQKAQDSFFLTDDSVIKQAVASQLWGVAYHGDLEQARLLLSRWDSLWESSEPMAPFRSLGL